MDKRQLRIIFLTGLMACFSFFLLPAQPSVKTSVDKNEILIGEQFNLKIEAAFSPEPDKVSWPAIPDSISHFEVISRSKMDSLYTDTRLTGIVQTITLTSFDSGKWTLPSFLVGITSTKDDSAHNFFTDSMPVTVSFSMADSTSNQLRDIKPIREVVLPNYLWYWIAAGVLLVGLIIFLIWIYRRRKKNKAPASLKTKASPYEEAMNELESLKAYDLSLAADIKIVHTRLAEILKRYLSRKQNNNYADKTTSDVLILLRDHYPDKELLAKAAASLRCGDAVKFAKYVPLAEESETCRQSIKEVIDAIERSAQSKTNNPTS